MVATPVCCFSCGRPIAEYIPLYNAAIDSIKPELSLSSINQNISVKDLLDAWELLTCCRIRLTTGRSTVLDYK
jgi:DNA-directed RNA polymerase subunit N (RpoN/RPB10)